MQETTHKETQLKGTDQSKPTEFKATYSHVSMYRVAPKGGLMRLTLQRRIRGVSRLTYKAHRMFGQFVI